MKTSTPVTSAPDSVVDQVVPVTVTFNVSVPEPAAITSAAVKVWPDEAVVSAKPLITSLPVLSEGLSEPVVSEKVVAEDDVVEEDPVLVVVVSIVAAVALAAVLVTVVPPNVMTPAVDTKALTVPLVKVSCVPVLSFCKGMVATRELPL